MTAVLVSHPHAGAVSVAAAQALERHGQLARYATGIVANEGSLSGQLGHCVSRYRAVATNRIVGGISASHLSSHPFAEVAARVVGECGNLLGQRGAKYAALFFGHDLAVAAGSWPRETDAVYAYEDAALATFRKAKRLKNIACVWDLPLPSHQSLERIWDEEFRRWPGAMGSRPHAEPAWKIARKNEELQLADVVSVASAHTRRSVEELGVTKPIAVAPYGFPLESFQPKANPNQGPLTVLSVGTHDLRKGTPYLLEAWRQAGIRDARLKLVGPLKLTSAFLQQYEGLFEHLPHVPKAELEAHYQSADLLAFPTLGDGFGLVIQEAMTCGTPVATTRMGGGPECIDHGVDGWILPERNLEALVEHFRFCAQNRDAVHEVGRQARQKAESRNWKDAGDVFVAELGHALARIN